MESKYDPQSDAMYLYFREQPYAYGEDLDDARRIDYASDNTPIGVELLYVSEGVNTSELPYEKDVIRLLKGKGIKTYSMKVNIVTGQRGYSGLISTFSANLEVLKKEGAEIRTLSRLIGEEITA